MLHKLTRHCALPIKSTGIFKINHFSYEYIFNRNTTGQIYLESCKAVTTMKFIGALLVSNLDACLYSSIDIMPLNIFSIFLQRK